MIRSRLRGSTASIPDRTRLFALVASVALLMMLCTAVVASAGDDTITDLDENTPLTEKSTWKTFEKEGVATADVAAPDLSITVAKEHEDVDAGGFHNDFSNEFIRVTYNEDIDRTIRFYIPSNYWGTYYDESTKAIAGDDATAKFVPVADGRYMAVTIHFDGPTDAVFAVDQLKGKTWSFWADKDAKIEDATGFSSGIAGTEQWQYASESDWNNGTLVVPNVSESDELLIQYDADVSSQEEVWLRVPEGESRNTPAYFFVRESSDADKNASVVIVSTNDSPPSIRLKKQATARDGVGSVWNDWAEIPNRVGDFFDSVFGSGRK